MRSLALALLTMAAAPSLAANLVVTTTLDTVDDVCDSHCSLRDAVVVANADYDTDNIILDEGTYTLSIPGVDEPWGYTGDLDLRRDVNIIGKGPERTIVDANSIDRVFNTPLGGVTVTFKGLTITGGRLESQAIRYGGGARLVGIGSDITIDNCWIEGNSSSDQVTSHGGGLLVDGPSMTIRNSMIRSNSAGEGGAIWVRGGDTVLTIERSTIYNNSTFAGTGAIDTSHATINIDTSTIALNPASGSTGGLRNQYGVVNIVSSTISDNTGAEIEALSDGSGVVSLSKTIIKGTCDVESENAIHSNWYNIESPGSTCYLGLQDKFNVADVMLDSLAWNGGPTLTMNPQPESVAVDTDFPIADPSCPNPDQRGIFRPQDGEADPDTEAECDIGAVERVPGLLFYDGFECGYTTSWSSATP